ncbi:hypothetical protein ASD24_24245 [Paenibacillus sp. Root52]|uniref:fibronectin type III domain-containing protein n=1 Tax=Paenibacillus sp. Root52 TaxID=1736552 RepID=UPI000701C4E4|nr:S-layer homology domain-containing protein [Paenibacillus sp. Root52]KQY90912.1 hypothetical protein ASD24_24245 [Paenibacillus sp. Root52]
MKKMIGKVLSVVLSASLVLGSVPLWGGGTAEAAVNLSTDLHYENPNIIQSGRYGTSFLDVDHKLISFGYRSQTGRDGSTITITEPVIIPSEVSLFTSINDNNYIVDTEGVIWGWGANYSGSLGLGSSVRNSVKYPLEMFSLGNVDSIVSTDRYAAAIKDGELYRWSSASNTPIKSPIDGKVKKVGLSLSGTEILILLDDGRLMYAGNGASNLYNGKGNVSKSEYTQVPVPSVSNFWLNGDMAVVLTTEGKFLAWGDSYAVDNGINEITKVPGNIKTVSVGYNHIALLTENGDVYTAGRNAKGQSGFSSSLVVYSKEFIKPERFPSDVVYAYAGYENTFLVTRSGKTYAVGQNENAQLGLGNDNIVTIPTLIPALTNRVALSSPVLHIPNTPSNFKVTTEETSLTASWDSVEGATTYKVIVAGQEVYSGTSLTYTYQNLVADTEYTVDVVAVNSKGESGKSSLTVKTKKNVAPDKLEAPTSLEVDSTEENNVKISWAASKDALIYKVLRNGTEVGSVAGTTYTDKTATVGESYIYSVKAFDGNKTSDASNIVVVTVTPKAEEPKVPAVPTNFKVVSDEHSVTASWDAAEGALDYKVVINGLEVYTGSDLAYTYTGLPEKTEYRVELSAVNAIGASGTQLMTIWTKDPKKLPAAKNPMATTTSNEAVISWDAVEGATEYWVKVNNDVIYEGTDTTVTAKGLKPDRPYTVYIYAKAGVVEGEPATIHIVTKKETVMLEKPANLVLTPKAASVKATWDAVNGASGYKLMNGNSVIYQGPLTTFTDVDLTEGTTYNYSVFAMSGDVLSEATIGSTTTLVQQLSYPVNFRVTDLRWDSVVFDWDAVDGADEYLITREGQPIGVPMTPGWTQSGSDLAPGSTYTYRVAAYKGGVLGKEAMKVVTIPSEPIEGEAPTGDLVIKANRVQHDRVGLSWNTVTGATYYEVYQDQDYKVWSGTLNAVTDPNVGPQEIHTYKVVAGNEWGTLESNVIEVITPAAPQSIVITPSQPTEGTITFNYKVVEGAVMYTERNPQTKAVPLGDGTYHVTYYNSATGETRDEGIQTPVNGMLRFTETGVDPGKNYHYDITAILVRADGTEEVVAKEEISVNTPSDGSGATVPGTITDPGTGGGDTPDPGTGGGSTTPGGNTGTTPPPSTGGGNNSGSAGDQSGNTGSGSAGGNGNTGTSAGGTNVTPVEDKNSVPGVVKEPTTGNEDQVTDNNQDNSTEYNNNYSDIAGNFAEDAIKNLTASGIIKGYKDGTFGPNKKITRAEFAIMTTRALGYENSGAYVQTFVDFDTTSWYAEELLTALDAKVTKGFTDGTYRPNVKIPREQAAVMISNVLEKNNYENHSEKVFLDDREIIAWARTSVYLLKNHGIVEGQNNLFYPKRDITRAEAALMIYRLLDVLKK